VPSGGGRRRVIWLVLGGARSGKSALAERLCRAAGREAVTYLATSVARDPDMADRIATHRARRPPTWVTVEPMAADLVDAVRGAAEATVLLDSLTAWVAESPGFLVDGDGLCQALAERSSQAASVVVSDEVGWGVHPSTEAGRRFRDQLGDLNQLVAEVADGVLLVVAGRVLPLERADGLVGCGGLSPS
jgi:adenosyl cobinamide kinase/adenosyl cobinamide phosphate guanylyltransferase